MTRAVIQIRHEADEMAAITAMADQFFDAWESGNQQDPVAVLTFSSPAQLFTIISPKRWELIEQLQKIGPTSIRGLGRSLNRGIKRVHEDVSVLIDWGIIEKDDEGKVFVPYNEIEADFTLKAAA
ncbi:transcriptional regulator [Phyllobacterium zundukense]|uniref:Transcriptional regulator n=1 Tax=Phyllobacterium zundukense TaxID=1867719 RepID=A0A2N9VYL8_9HYPH|nr:transcriptional regulator [Phyllobacterium zundukense]ATU95175.1 transcriptional regulator [Phyllobacterium zundukense]PIO44586.1 transcriptional regulator [Phyllobacterium zundukense]